MNLYFMWLAITCLGLYISITINLWIGLFLCYSVFSASRHPTTDTGAALLSVILGCVLLVVLYHAHNKKAVVTLFVLFGIMNLIFIIAQVNGSDHFITKAKGVYLPDGQIRMGFVDCRNSLSAAFAFCFPIFWSRRLFWGIPLMIIGLIMAKTVGGVLATVPTFLYFGHVFLGKKIIIAVLIIMIGVLAYIQYVDRPDPGGRLAAWTLAADLQKRKAHNPWLGAGLGMWSEIFGYRDPKTNECVPCKIIQERAGYAKPVWYQQAHSEPIQVNFEMGRIGIGLIVGYFLSVLLRVRKIEDPRPILILLAIIIDSMVFFPIHIPLLSVVIILTIAWVERELCEPSKYACLSALSFSWVGTSLRQGKSLLQSMRSIRLLKRPKEATCTHN